MSSAPVVVYRHPSPVRAKTKPTDLRTVTSLIVLVAAAAFLLLACEQAAPPPQGPPPIADPEPEPEPHPEDPPEQPLADDPSEPDTKPTFGDATVPAHLYFTAGEAITPLTLPAARGGNGILSYSLSFTDQGLTFDPATRTLSGVPRGADVGYLMSYQVTDEDGDTATLEFEIRILLPCAATVRGACAHPPSPSPGPARAVSIEVVFGDDVPGFIRDAVLSAALWWETAFTADFGPPMTVHARDTCGGWISDETRTVDDLLIAVSMYDPPDEPVVVDGVWYPAPKATGGPCATRGSGLPYLGQVNFISLTAGRDAAGNSVYDFDLDPANADHHLLYNTARHEIAHVLGFGTSQRWGHLVRDGAFHGPAAMAEFGWPVPTTGRGSLSDDIHWDSDRFYDLTGSVLMQTAVMASGSPAVIAVTLAAFQDLGFAVDYSVAEKPACESRGQALFRPGECFDLPGIHR